MWKEYTKEHRILLIATVMTFFILLITMKVKQNGYIRDNEGNVINILTTVMQEYKEKDLREKNWYHAGQSEADWYQDRIESHLSHFRSKYESCYVIIPRFTPTEAGIIAYPLQYGVTGIHSFYIGEKTSLITIDLNGKTPDPATIALSTWMQE